MKSDSRIADKKQNTGKKTRETEARFISFHSHTVTPLTKRRKQGFQLAMTSECKNKVGPVQSLSPNETGVNCVPVAKLNLGCIQGAQSARFFFVLMK
jgi:hypothetical protein